MKVPKVVFPEVFLGSEETETSWPRGPSSQTVMTVASQDTRQESPFLNWKAQFGIVCFLSCPQVFSGTGEKLVMSHLVEGMSLG